jgi:hypothetical protein
MAAKLIRVTHEIAIQLHLVAQSRAICSSRSRQPVWKLLDIPSYAVKINVYKSDILGTPTTFQAHDPGRSTLDTCPTAFVFLSPCRVSQPDLP